MPRKGIPRAISNAALSAAIGTGRRITKRESRYQKPASVGRRVALGAALEEARRERVDPRAEHAQDRRQDDQRDRGGEQRHQRPADPHRVEEALREDEQRGERRGDGERGEEDRAPRGPHRRPERLPALRPAPGSEVDASPRDLLAVAGDDEEAVVDRQPEAEARWSG